MQPNFKINNFDLIRIYAASQVMVLHSFRHLRIPMPTWLSIINYFPGVPIFFVISGYLISSSYERSGGLSHYFTNRVLRIFPGLWACIGLTIITASMVGHIDFFNAQTPLWLASQMTGLIYTPQFLSGYGFGSYNGALWTIPIELQFYIILPLVYFLLYRITRKKTALFSILIAFILIAYVTPILFPTFDGPAESKMEKLFRYTFMPHFYLFLAGVVLQRLQAYESRLVFGKGFYWLGMYLLFIYLVPNFSNKSLLSGLLLAVCVVSMAYTVPDMAHRLLRGHDISYGVYIYHGIIINMLVEYHRFEDLSYLFLLYAVTYAIAFLSWTYIEKPMLRRKPNTINTTNIDLIPNKQLVAPMATQTAPSRSP
jgi:peptidoglycan/LPS O-acetylase OafA/YrhL